MKPEILLPFIISNGLSLWILWLAFMRPHTAKGFLSILFLGSGMFNIYTSFTNPHAYMAFAGSAYFDFYRQFIQGFFSHNITIIVSAIAVGQLYTGISMLMDDVRFRFGCSIGLLFTLAIAPLGIGSAFPSTLLLSASFLVLLLKEDKSTSRRPA